VLLVFYDETEEARLNKTREEFSQMLIHDLRSPLTSVTTSLKLLTDVVPKDDPVRGIVETTVDAGRSAIRKLLGRVDSLLDVSKMEQGFMSVDAKPTELATLVDNVCVELSPMAQDLGVVIRSDLRADLPLLEIDADKTERVLLNLVDNALKFSPADSTVIVRAHEPGAEGAAPGFVRIDVVDSGPGVADEYKMMLFDRYVQIRGRKGARRGTGLGLTFCRLVAETHGGRIWIDDNPTGGSIFSFTLPVAVENELDISSDDQLAAE
jgi:two-component system, NtrC family, sensor histidine kinase KinB